MREKLSDDDLAKGVKLKFMAEIDFKCFSKVVKSFLRTVSINDAPHFLSHSLLLLAFSITFLAARASGGRGKKIDRQTALVWQLISYQLSFKK